MSAQTHHRSDIVTEDGDAIRIVPLHVASDAGTPTVDVAKLAPPVAPKLVYGNGPLLTQVQVFTIFWGVAWQQAANAALLAQVNQFFDFILTSPLIDQLAEYSVPGKQIGHGSHVGTLTTTSPVLGRSVTDTAVQHMLQQLISSGSVPQAMPNLLYFIYLPPGVKLIQFARALRGDHRSHPGTGLLRQPQRRDRGHLRVEDEEDRALHRATRMVRPRQRVRMKVGCNTSWN